MVEHTHSKEASFENALKAILTGSFIVLVGMGSGHLLNLAFKALLAGAEERARSLGAHTLEAYPVAPGDTLDPADAWHGLESMFVAAGFDEVARHKPRRPIYRKTL